MQTGELPTLTPPGWSWRTVVDAAPEAGRLVLYRTEQYQMMGYLARSGRWIGSDGKEEPMAVRWWREFEKPPLGWAERKW